jgi:tRNA threonylcarbamoyladenosine biosynthesis protein TsaE
MIFEAPTLEHLDTIADSILKLRQHSNVFAFYGAMGAGKTTLIKKLCRAMGVTDEVNSPTFSLVNEYLTEEGESVFHFDFYRINKLEEAFDIGYENYFYSPDLCLIEWPDKIEQLLPEKCVYVSIEVVAGTETRIIRCDLYH